MLCLYLFLDDRNLGMGIIQLLLRGGVLRAYITSDQLSRIRLNKEVKVIADGADQKEVRYEGVVIWISDKAEFTPKTIQTRDERANLVYATKIRVQNDGMLKVGMYGEIIINDE